VDTVISDANTEGDEKRTCAAQPSDAGIKASESYITPNKKCTVIKIRCLGKLSLALMVWFLVVELIHPVLNFRFDMSIIYL
jgi:hypothetical protein